MKKTIKYIALSIALVFLCGSTLIAASRDGFQREIKESRFNDRFSEVVSENSTATESNGLRGSYEPGAGSKEVGSVPIGAPVGWILFTSIFMYGAWIYRSARCTK
jgi:hypothetical protein